MTYTPTIYDWRSSLRPAHQMFRAGGQMQEGGLTIGGARVGNPEPGGVAELVCGWNALGRGNSIGRDVSWTISRILSRNIMRFSLCNSPQLVPAADLGVTDLVSGGLPWDGPLLWDNGQPWDWDVRVPVSVAASRGASEVVLDLSTVGEVLQIGHVIGVSVDGYDFAHKVMDVTYDASDVATAQISPPLRRALTTSHEMSFRPKMLVTCANAREVASLYEYRSFSALNQARFVEALV